MKPIPFLQARHFRNGPRKHVDLVVIHSAEIGETLNGAEALMAVCARNDRTASWHYAVDADSITQSVMEEDIAFHAPGANHNGIGIELSGRARQSQADWQDAYSLHMLDRCAELVAGICQRWAIPVQLVDMWGLRAGSRGITTHDAVSKAFKKSTHTDPGAHFPMEWLLERVRHFQRRADTEPPPTEPSPPPEEP